MVNICVTSESYIYIYANKLLVDVGLYPVMLLDCTRLCCWTVPGYVVELLSNLGMSYNCVTTLCLSLNCTPDGDVTHYFTGTNIIDFFGVECAIKNSF